MTGRIGVVGSSMTDLVTYGDRPAGPGETREAARFSIGRGGKGANQAVAAAKLGASVVMVSRVGSDAFGRDTLAEFAKRGIDTSHVREVDGQSSGVASIFVDAKGENSILIVKGANDTLRPADIDAAAPALLGCELILLQLEIPLDTVAYTIEWARRNRRRVLLNPAPATRSLGFEQIASVDYFVPNQTELALLTGLATDSVGQAEAAARAALGQGLRSVIVTLGADGALLVTAERSVRIAPVAVEAQDTTGAGDAFIGAFAFHEVAGWPLEEALRRAAAYAAHSVTRSGAQGSFASADEFEEFRRQLGL